MGFRYDDAKKAGLSDAEIIEGLAKKSGFRLQEARSEGLGDDEILKGLLGRQSSQTAPSSLPARAAQAYETGKDYFEETTGKKLFPTKEDFAASPKRAVVDTATTGLRVLGSVPRLAASVFPEEKERTLEEVAGQELKGPVEAPQRWAQLANPMTMMFTPGLMKWAQKKRAQEKIAKGVDPKSTEEVPMKIIDSPKALVETGMYLVPVLGPSAFIAMLGEAAVESTHKARGLPEYKKKEGQVAESGITLGELKKEWLAPYEKAWEEKSFGPIRDHVLDNPEAALFDLGIFIGAGVAGKKVATKTVQAPSKAAAALRKRTAMRELKALDNYAERLQGRLTNEEYNRAYNHIMTKAGIPPEATTFAKKVLADVAPEVNLEYPAYLRNRVGRRTIQVRQEIAEGGQRLLPGSTEELPLQGTEGGEGFTVREKPPEVIVRKRDPDFVAVGRREPPVVEYKSKKGSTNPRAQRVAPEYFSKNVEPYVRELIGQVKAGEPGGRIFDYDVLGQGGAPVVSGFGSTYPDFMRNQGWTKEKVLTALEKGVRGDKLGVLEQRIWDSALEQARKEYVDANLHYTGEYPPMERGLEKLIPEEEPAVGTDFSDVFEFDEFGKEIKPKGKPVSPLLAVAAIPTKDEDGNWTFSPWAAAAGLGLAAIAGRGRSTKGPAKLPRKPTGRERASADAMKRYRKAVGRTAETAERAAGIENLRPGIVKETVEGMKPEAAEHIANVYAERETAPVEVQGARIRNAVAEDMFAPIEGNATSESAVSYSRTQNFDDYVAKMPRAVSPEGAALGLGKSPDRSVQIVDPVTANEIMESKLPDLKHPRLKLESTDIRRLSNEIDGGEAGPITNHVLLPSRDTIMARDVFADKYKGLFDQAFVKYRVRSPYSKRRVWDLMDGHEEVKNPTRNELAARDALRGIFDDLIEKSNKAREQRGQELIPYRENYVTYAAERTLIDRLLGRDTKPEWVMEGPGAPDFIVPGKSFNPRELAREVHYKAYKKDKDLARLAGRYVDTMANDIFYTNAIQNIKAHSALLKQNGRPNAAWVLEQWGSRAFAGAKHPFDVVVESFPLLRHAFAIQKKITDGLKRSVFPANLSFNVIVQTSSHATLAPMTSFHAMAEAVPLMFSQKHRAIVEQTYAYHQKTRAKSQYSNEWMEQKKRFKVLEKTGKLDTMADRLNYLTNLTEKELSMHAGITAYLHGKSKGLKGRELSSFMDNTMQRVMSLYNHADLPGILQSKHVSATVPFQTFAFEAWNNLREMFGKTGMHKEMSQKKYRRMAKWIVGMYVTNAVGQAAVGRSPWEWEAFMPFASVFEGALGSSGRYARAGGPVGYAATTQLMKAVRNYVEHGDLDETRRWIMRYTVPAGTQINRMIEAETAWNQGGRVKDVTGRTIYKMKPDQQLKSYAAGPGATKQGIESREERFEAYQEKIPGPMVPAFPLLPLGKVAVDLLERSQKNK